MYMMTTADVQHIIAIGESSKNITAKIYFKLHFEVK
jgi:hypothetical protein